MTYTRTVHVVDTLNPVITLKYNSVVVKTGLAGDMALDTDASSPVLTAQINPADTTADDGTSRSRAPLDENTAAAPAALDGALAGLPLSNPSV